MTSSVTILTELTIAQRYFVKTLHSEFTEIDHETLKLRVEI